MSKGVPFDPSVAVPGTILRGIDPTSLQAGRRTLERRRLEFQFQLRKLAIARTSMITVHLTGIVYDGNRAVRVAIDEGDAVDITITDEPTTAYGLITDVPIEE